MASEGASETGSCPLCGSTLHAWIALPAAGDVAVVGAPLGDRERVLDRCESCGVALERAARSTSTAEWTAVCRPADPHGRRIAIPNRASLQAAIGVEGWAAIELSPGRLIHTPASLKLLAQANDHTIERERGAFSRRAQAWMWQTLLNGLTFRANFGRELRAGRLHPQRHPRAGALQDRPRRHGPRRAAGGAGLVPLELGATLAGRGGELLATARDVG